MVRGCQRKVIFLKNTESKIFSEAYFIVDDKAPPVSETDMVKEANRIIEENLARTRDKGSARSPIRRTLLAILKSIPAFFVGGGVATVICLIFL